MFPQHNKESQEAIETMLRQNIKKQATCNRMATYDQETAHAWALIMKKILQLRAQGETLEAIGKLFNVGRGTVSRWISEEFGGEKTTFGDMLRYAKALGISVDELIGQPHEAAPMTTFDKALASVLKQAATDADLAIEDIAKLTGLTEVQVSAIFAGEVPTTGATLHAISKAVEVGASILLKKAEKSLHTK